MTPREGKDTDRRYSRKTFIILIFKTCSVVDSEYFSLFFPYFSSVIAVVDFISTIKSI